MSDNGTVKDIFIPAPLAEIIEGFSLCEGQEKLEYLLEFSEKLQPLPAHLAARQDERQEIHECMTPVFVYGEIQDGKLIYWFDAPPESPTVRGFATIMMEGVNHQATPEEVLRIPDNFYLETGLQTVLTGQRMHGMSTFLNYMKQIASQKLTPS